MLRGNILLTLSEMSLVYGLGVLPSSLSKEHRVQRSSVCRYSIKTREKPLKKWVFFDCVTVSLHILYTASKGLTKTLCGFRSKEHLASEHVL